MNIKFENKGIYSNGQKVIEFEYPIDQIVVYKKAIVVLLNHDFYKVNNENVFCIDHKGNLLWQVPSFEYIDKRSPFVGIRREGENVKLFNWSGEFVVIEPLSGKIIIHPKDSNKRPW